VKGVFMAYSIRDCQTCNQPCFTFLEKVGVCPQDIGLDTPEHYQEYLDYFHPQPETPAGDLLEPSDCCPMYEEPP